MIKNDLHDIAKMLASKYGISVNEAKTFTNTFIDLVNEGLQEELAGLHKTICRRFGQLATPDGRSSLQEEFGKFMFRLPEGQR